MANDEQIREELDLEPAIELLQAMRPGVSLEAWTDFLLSRGAWGKGGNSAYMHISPEEIIRAAALSSRSAQAVDETAYEQAEITFIAVQMTCGETGKYPLREAIKEYLSRIAHPSASADSDSLRQFVECFGIATEVGQTRVVQINSRGATLELYKKARAILKEKGNA